MTEPTRLPEDEKLKGGDGQKEQRQTKQTDEGEEIAYVCASEKEEEWPVAVSDREKGEMQKARGKRVACPGKKERRTQLGRLSEA